MSYIIETSFVIRLPLASTGSCLGRNRTRMCTPSKSCELLFFTPPVALGSVSRMECSSEIGESRQWVPDRHGIAGTEEVSICSHNWMENCDQDRWQAVLLSSNVHSVWRNVRRRGHWSQVLITSREIAISDCVSVCYWFQFAWLVSYSLFCRDPIFQVICNWDLDEQIVSWFDCEI